LDVLGLGSRNEGSEHEQQDRNSDRIHGIPHSWRMGAGRHDVHQRRTNQPSHRLSFTLAGGTPDTRLMIGIEPNADFFARLRVSTRWSKPSLRKLSKALPSMA
jgi:hypothetical protein